MSNFSAEPRMEVVPSDEGFRVVIIGANALATSVDGFATQDEADAWVLQRAMKLDDALTGLRVMTPGGSLA